MIRVRRKNSSFGGGEAKPSKNLYEQLCNQENLLHAFEKARKRKTLKPYVVLFEAELEQNLNALRKELLAGTYQPRPLTTFILRDPKTRKISKSDFRDRIIHHAIINIIEPLFDRKFIADSYANRRGKGTLKAIERFDTFKRQASKNLTQNCFVLKADVQHYFDTVDHEILVTILKRRIKDEKVINLIKIILENHKTDENGKGMPLGNLTSQFFANVYLNELDQFVKHELKAKHYIRYVDDFVIFNTDNATLEDCKNKIDLFLEEKLKLRLHPDKSHIIPLTKGVGFLGFRIFPHHKLLRHKNMRRFEKRLQEMKRDFHESAITREKVIERFEGWLAYTKHADTYKYRRELTRQLNKAFPFTPTTTITKPKKHERTQRRIAQSSFEYSPLKTLSLYQKGLSIDEIAAKRGIKENTVWEHFAKLIEHNQCNLWHILPDEKIRAIRKHIRNKNDTLKTIKARLYNTATYDEIACVLAHVKKQNKKQTIFWLVRWLQRTQCKNQCDYRQKNACKEKLKQFALANPTLQMRTKDFVEFLMKHMHICKRQS